MNDSEHPGDWQNPLLKVAPGIAVPADDETRTLQRLETIHSIKPAAKVELPSHIDRYRVEKVLGEGGFGVVYLAHDGELKRRVAIKVPQAHRIRSPKDAETYLVEAQVLATLDHPHIVPVFDVGRSEDGLPFVVSKFIEGCNLAERIKASRLSIQESVLLVARMADALHYAHQHRLVHRDVKPGNILLDNEIKPFLVDFGLALKEEDFGKEGGILGTPNYMSPEQANGEGHLVDGRSDIYSLGVVLYELLSGQLPFTSSVVTKLLSMITSAEPRLLRQIDPEIPKELERICLKALSKRASERYPTALDFGDDLKHWLQPKSTTEKGPASIRIVPKGLRSFDVHDADFFLELLPGPRDREGLPDSIRFWKTRIEETDADSTFKVGLIYGPSGCGKSSFVKAGLLPRLSEDMIAVYIEATAQETETRLLNGLRKFCPALSNQLSLKETLAAFRRGKSIPPEKKVLIVLDQFEQWLHAKKEKQNTELVQSLRQCDGGKVQCIVMVRDDFGMAATRLMKALEVEIVEGHNFATIDLFDLLHSRKVLAEFGRSFGRLPDNLGNCTNEQESFLNQAVSGLAQDGKVISVRLALFAEMVKGKPWTPTTLEEVGGTEGVGVTFLEETFSSQAANPKYRLHQKAAQAVLKALLPESGMDIKGYMRSYAELLEASGYGSRSKDFDDLIRILDGEIRLVTPTDPEGKEEGSFSKEGEKYYQLTHDYLVHSLRDWLTRKQKETRRGRAELLLADRAGVWNARLENRQLPSLLQWFQIRRLTTTKNWTPPQRKMMRKAGKYHAVRVSALALLLAVATVTGLAIREQVVEQQKATHAAGLVESLLKAHIAQVPAIISDLNAYRVWSDPLLRTKIAEATDGSTAKLVLALALLSVDESQVVDYLTEQLPDCTLEQFPVVRKALFPHNAEITDALWRVTQDESASRRFQAAAALAEYVPDDERWQQTAPFVAQHLTSAISSVNLGQWRQFFQPASKALTGPLTGIHADRTRSEKQREAAALVLSDYLADQPMKLVDVILISDELAEFTPLIAALKPHAASVSQPLLSEIQTTMPVHLAKTNDRLSEGDRQLRDGHWKRQSLAAATLVHLGYGDEVWPLLKFSPNPSLRSLTIQHLGKLGTNHNTLAARLETETEVTIRRALIQSLGGLDAARIPKADCRRIAERLLSLYVNDPDSGIHGSASWTLRKWGEALPKLPAGETVLNEQKTPFGNSVRRWYVNGQGQTMNVIPIAVADGKSQIATGLAISSHEVTVAEFRRFREKHGVDRVIAPTDDCPVNSVSWYDTAEYCNWLSKLEGIPEDQLVYQPNEKGQYSDGMKIKEKWSELHGYRLPTGAEWESACRSGTSGSYGFGEPISLLKHYGWYLSISLGRSYSVESLLPNEAGLFDMHGNNWEWTQNPVSGPLSPVDAGIMRVLRGGSFVDLASRLRPADPGIVVMPAGRDIHQVFRLARTCTP